MSRKSFNLSLQKRRNEIVLNPIIQECEKDGTYIADRVVDYVEKALVYERSMGLSKVVNTFGLIKNTLSSQYPEGSEEHSRRVEDVLRSVISIDGERLAQFISDPYRYSSEASSMEASESRAPIERTEPVTQHSPTPPPLVEEEIEEVEEEIEETPPAKVKQKRESKVVLVEEDDDEAEEMKKHKEALAERRRKRKEERERREKEEKEAQRKAKSKGKSKSDDDEDDDDNDSELDFNISAIFND